MASPMDDIEDCSEGEGETSSVAMARPAAKLNPSGVADRFASYLGARQPEVGQESDGTQAFALEASAEIDASQEFETNHDIGPGPPSRADAHDVASEAVDDDFFAPFLNGNDDGTFTGGPAADDLEAFRQEEPLALDGVALAEAAPAEESDESADEGNVAGGVDEPPLPAEAWAERSAKERELWERVRPRAVRREAARMKELKLPNAAVNRLMRVHPDLQTKSSEALEIINYATVLMVQAAAQASVRGRKAAGQTVRLEDVKQVCLQNRELNFLLPLSATLDASALSVTHQIHDDGDEVAGKRVIAAAPGQSTLNSATFTRTAAPPQEATEDAPEEALDGVDVQEKREVKAQTPAKKGNKRKLPPSAKKAASKAPRQKSPVRKEEKAPASLASFFKRPEAQTS